MFDQTIQRVGFACQILQPDGKQHDDHKIGTTTQKVMFGLTESKRVEKLHNKIKQNIRNLHNQLKYVATLPANQRMFRISSTMLPMYDHPDLKYLYNDQIMPIIENSLARSGEFARDNDIRLSMHPDQFCVLNSDNPDVVDRSIECFEMHCDIARMLGFGKQFQDMKINVHANGKGDILPMDRLSDVAKNCLTIENDERTGNFDRVIAICEQYGVPMVFDIHHHFCNSGEYMLANDERIERVIATWKGVRPTMHVSQSTDYIWQSSDLPCMETILLEHKRGKTFAHSDFIDNNGLIDIVRDYRTNFDLMVEAKQKNLATEKFMLAL